MSRQVNALLSRKLLNMETPTANIQAITLCASKTSASTIRVTMLTSTPEAPTRANFQKRPAEGTYQNKLRMCVRYSKPWRTVALDTPAWRTWNSKGVSSTLSSGAHTSISSSTLNPVGLNWMPEIDWFFMRKKPVIGSFVLRASLKTIRARYLLPTDTPRRILLPERPA